MRPGATCFLGVNVEGALFSIGDGHYRQGEGRPAARPSRAR
jgi:acetamidase/formamidase